MISNLNKSTFPGVALPLSDGQVTSTTGSPTTGTYTDSGISYKYYSFTGSGSITTSKSGLVDVLVVGSGGGGGANGRGGGGAGGFLYVTSHYLSAGSNTVTVGAGGVSDRPGNSSAINNLYGIFGGSGRIDGGGDGASASGTYISSYIASAVSGQGNIGGTGNNNGQTPTAGGGGGASAAGANGTSVAGGNGGAGTANSITGSSVTYAGGGGGTGYTSAGGTGGAGGGGNGGRSSSVNGSAGTANTGGGGGGAYNGGTGGAGGSGLVVIRVRA